MSFHISLPSVNHWKGKERRKPQNVLVCRHVKLKSPQMSLSFRLAFQFEMLFLQHFTASKQKSQSTEPGVGDSWVSCLTSELHWREWFQHEWGFGPILARFLEPSFLLKHSSAAASDECREVLGGADTKPSVHPSFLYNWNLYPYLFSKIGNK